LYHIVIIEEGSFIVCGIADMIVHGHAVYTSTLLNEISYKQIMLKKRTFYIDEDVDTKIRVRAVQQGKRFHEIASEAFKFYLDNIDKKRK
jgi:hypothetical protein